MTNVNKWTNGPADRSAENNWIADGEVVSSETRPDRFWPCVSYRRVTGSKYWPYRSGSAEWRAAANRELADCAQANFANGKR